MSLKSDVYAKQVGDQGAKAEIGDINGRVRMIRFLHTFAADVNDIGVIVKLCQLPAGARVVDYRIGADDLGTTGAAKLGWAASADGKEVADDDGLRSAVTMTSATDTELAAADAVYMKKFVSPVDIQAEFTAATDGAEGDKIFGHILYVLD